MLETRSRIRKGKLNNKINKEYIRNFRDFMDSLNSYKEAILEDVEDSQNPNIESIYEKINNILNSSVIFNLNNFTKNKILSDFSEEDKSQLLENNKRLTKILNFIQSLINDLKEKLLSKKEFPKKNFYLKNIDWISVIISKIRNTSDNMLDALKILDKNSENKKQNNSFIKLIKNKFIDIKLKIRNQDLDISARKDVKLMRNEINTLNNYYENLRNIEKNIIYSNNISGKVIEDYVNDVLNSNIISNILKN